MYFQKQLTRLTKKLARKEFIKLWKEVEEVSGLEAYTEASQLKFKAIPFFILSKDAVNYDYSRSITIYLVPNERNPLEMAIMFRKNKRVDRKKRFSGIVNCNDPIFYTSCEPCKYDDSDGEEINTLLVIDRFRLINC